MRHHVTVNIACAKSMTNLAITVVTEMMISSSDSILLHPADWMPDTVLLLVSGLFCVAATGIPVSHGDSYKQQNKWDAQSSVCKRKRPWQA